MRNFKGFCRKPFKGFFQKPKLTEVLDPMDKLIQTLKMLEEKERTYEKQASRELKNAVKRTRAGRGMAASLCFDMKGACQKQSELVERLQCLIKKRILKLEEVQATKETADALRTAEVAMLEMREATNIDDGGEIMNGIMASLRRFQDSLASAPVAAADSDEEELEALDEELEELEELHQPATTATAPAAPVHVPTGPRRARTVRRRTAEEDAPADSQAEVAP